MNALRSARYLWRSRPLLGAGVMLLLGPAFIVAVGNDGDAALRLRLVGAVLAILLALVWEDAAAPVTAATAVGLPAVQRARLMLLLLVLSTGWALSCVAASTEVTQVLVWSATIEIAAVAAVLTAVVGLLSRDRLGESMAAYPVPLLVVGLLLLTRVPPRWTLLASPGSPAWADAHRRWFGLLLLGLAVLAIAARDPARAPLLRRPLRRSP